MPSVTCPACGVKWIIPCGENLSQCGACGTSLSCRKNNYRRHRPPKMFEDVGRIIPVAENDGVLGGLSQIGRVVAKIFGFTSF